MMSDYEKNYLESMRTAAPLNLNDNMTEAERNLEIIRYIREAVKYQAIAYKKDLEEAYAFLDKISKEYEIEKAWEDHEE